MPDDPGAVVAPADSRVVVGSLAETSALFLKGKFFDCGEILGGRKQNWLREFHDGDYAIFRLTPDKYHYNHVPVSGRVEDFYEIPGDYHSCNPGAVVAMVTPYSKNKRWVTIIDTEVPGGTGVGLVAMIEVAALMIGEVVQLYSEGGIRRPEARRAGHVPGKRLPEESFPAGEQHGRSALPEGPCGFRGRHRHEHDHHGGRKPLFPWGSEDPWWKRKSASGPSSRRAGAGGAEENRRES